MQELLKLKEQYKTLTGSDVPSTGGAAPRKEKEKKPAAKPAEADHAAASGATDLKKQTK